MDYYINVFEIFRYEKSTQWHWTQFLQILEVKIVQRKSERNEMKYLKNGSD